MRRKLIYVLLATGLVLAAKSNGLGQRTAAATVLPAEKVYGPDYAVPEVKVYLIDEETGGPFAEREVTIKYYWGWDVIKRTDETDRVPSLVHMTIKRRTDVTGVVLMPTLLITPSRPRAPAGAEYSLPRFRFAGIGVNDAKHSTHMSVYDAEVNLLDDKGEVHRTVMLYPRPVKK